VPSEIVESLVEGKQPQTITLPVLMKGGAVEWDYQTRPA